MKNKQQYGPKAISRGNTHDSQSKDLAQPHHKSGKPNIEKYTFLHEVGKDKKKTSVRKEAFSHTVGEKTLFGRQLWQYLYKCNVFILPDIQIPPLKAILQEFSHMCPKVYVWKIFSTVLHKTVKDKETETT